MENNNNNDWLSILKGLGINPAFDEFLKAQDKEVKKDKQLSQENLEVQEPPTTNGEKMFEISKRIRAERKDAPGYETIRKAFSIPDPDKDNGLMDQPTEEDKLNEMYDDIIDYIEKLKELQVSIDEGKSYLVSELSKNLDDEIDKEFEQIIDIRNNESSNDDIETEINSEKKSDEVNHPSHYNQGSVEVIDIIEMVTPPSEFKGFLKGNIIKYVSRYQNKGGVKDLDKSIWYTKKLIEFEEKLKNVK